MSDNQKTQTPNPTPPAAGEVIEGVVIDTPAKAGFAQKSKTFIKRHKQTLISGAGLVVLMTVSAAAGRASAPTGDTFETHIHTDDLTMLPGIVEHDGNGNPLDVPDVTATTV